MSSACRKSAAEGRRKRHPPEKVSGGVLLLIALAAPWMAWAQPARGPERPDPTQFVIDDGQKQSVENFHVEDSECSRPAMLMIPQNGRIKRRALRELREAMRAYVTAMSNYVGCVREEFIVAESSSASTDVTMQIADQHNSAVNELVAVANAYVEQVGPIEELFNQPPPPDRAALSEGLARAAESLPPLSWWPGTPPSPK